MNIHDSQKCSRLSVILYFPYVWGYSFFLLHTLDSHAVPSPRNRITTSLPFNPTALIIRGSPGTRSIAWSPHSTSFLPCPCFPTSLSSSFSRLTSRTIPLIGFLVDNSTNSPSDFVMALTVSPSESTSGKVIYLNGSGLEIRNFHFDDLEKTAARERVIFSPIRDVKEKIMRYDVR